MGEQADYFLAECLDPYWDSPDEIMEDLEDGKIICQVQEVPDSY